MRVNPLVSGLLVPTTALAVALGPAVVPPPPTPTAVPVVHVESIALAGIGQDIYNAITPVVQYVVGGASYLINFVPVVGGIAAAQINIGYFQGIQPAVAATVDYAAALVHDPLDFFPITRGYVDTLGGIGRDLVSAELRFLGFNELPPRPAAGQRTVAPAPVAASERNAVVAPRPSTGARSMIPPAPVAAVRSPEQPRSTSPRGAAQRRGSAETGRQKSVTGRTKSTS